jgi:DNA-binding MarR family transcriptional regulator
MKKDTGFAEVMLWIRLATTFNLVYQEIKHQISRDRVTVPQLDIISCLGRTRGLPLSELAERLLVSGGNVTGIIDRLERDGYVYRARDDRDRRVIRALLTEKGYELYKTFLPRYKDIVTTINKGLTPQERKDLQRLLKKLSASVQQVQKARRE